MGIILKFILRNIKEKKLRTFLVVFSIIASTALFFASNGISTTIKKTFVNIMGQVAGNADIQISADSKSPTPYVYTSKADKVKNKVSYIIGETDANAIYTNDKKDRAVILRGFNYEDVESINPLNLVSEGSIKPFNGNKIIISKKAADKYNLSVGDKLPLRVGSQGVKEYFSIAAVAENKGFFAVESDKNMMAIIPQDTASDLSDVPKGQASVVFIKAKKASEIDGIVSTLSKTYKNYVVKRTVDEKVIDQETSQISTALKAMALVVLMMSVFIIYTVFKVIVAERLPIIGTFRSIGATRMSTSLVLVGESVVYGIIGGIIGDFVGIGVLNILTKLMASSVSGSSDIAITVTVSYTAMQLVQAFLFSLIVSFVSSVIPIARTAKLSVKDVVLNTVDDVEKEKVSKLVLGIIFTASAVVIPELTKDASYAGKEMTLILLAASMIISIIGIVILVPYITEIFVKLFEKIYELIFGNEGSLAIKNLRKNKSLMNNASLLTIGISALFMLNIVSFSVGKALIKAYSINKYDTVVYNDDGNSLDGSTVNRIKNADGVDKAEAMYESWNVKVSGTKDKIEGFNFITEDDFKNYLNVRLIQNEKNVLEDFKNGRTIMMTTTDLKKLNKSVGDYITVKTPVGDKDYKIVGSFSTLWNDGSAAFVPKKYAKGDFQLYQPNAVYIKTYKSPEYVKNILQKEFKTKQVEVNTLAGEQKEDADRIGGMLFLIKAFPVIALIIGIFGVINNFIISFIERKRSLAIYASVGMSRNQTRKMLFIESITIGLIGSIAGIIGGVLMVNIMPHMLLLANWPIDMIYSPKVFIESLALGVLITVLASLIPSLKSSKINIIEAIKYE